MKPGAVNGYMSQDHTKERGSKEWTARRRAGPEARAARQVRTETRLLRNGDLAKLLSCALRKPTTNQHFLPRAERLCPIVCSSG